MKIERRFAAGRVEVRTDAEGKAPVIRGHAAVFNDWYNLYEDDYVAIRERIIPGAFDNALRENQDVRALFNHDPSLILGRTKAGTTRLSLDARGLVYEVDADDTTVGVDVLKHLRRGDVDGSSFGFSVRKGGRVITRQEDPDTGKETIEVDLRDLDLFDVSPVTYPAYVGTDSEARSRWGDSTFLDSLLADRKARSKRIAAMELRGQRLRLMKPV